MARKKRQMSKEKFIEKAKQIHTDAYDYSTLYYVDLYTTASVVCPKHGRFTFSPGNHIRRKKTEAATGCPDCRKYKRFLNCAIEYDVVIKRLKEKYNGIYDYSKLIIYRGRKEYRHGDIETNTHKRFVRMKDYNIAICSIHGEFTITLNNHLSKKGSHCPTCAKELQRFQKLSKLPEVLHKANELHNHKFDYSLLTTLKVPFYLKNRGLDDEEIYVSTKDYHKIICPTHGITTQKLSSHIDTKNPKGCKKCAVDALRDTEEDFINKAKKVHGDLYNYSLVKIQPNSTVVIINCLVHGEFPQNRRDHLSGCGCPFCKNSLGEKKVYNTLCNKDIKSIQQKKFKECRNKQPLPFDFYLLKHKLLIEYQGEFHFQEIRNLQDAEGLKHRQKLDKIKKDFACKNYNFLELHYKDQKTIPEILEETFKILEEGKLGDFNLTENTVLYYRKHLTNNPK